MIGQDNTLLESPHESNGSSLDYGTFTLPPEQESRSGNGGYGKNSPSKHNHIHTVNVHVTSCGVFTAIGVALCLITMLYFCYHYIFVLNTSIICDKEIFIKIFCVPPTISFIIQCLCYFTIKHEIKQFMKKGYFSFANDIESILTNIYLTVSIFYIFNLTLSIVIQCIDLTNKMTRILLLCLIICWSLTTIIEIIGLSIILRSFSKHNQFEPMPDCLIKPQQNDQLTNNIENESCNPFTIINKQSIKIQFLNKQLESVSQQLLKIKFQQCQSGQKIHNNNQDVNNNDDDNDALTIANEKIGKYICQLKDCQKLNRQLCNENDLFKSRLNKKKLQLKTEKKASKQQQCVINQLEQLRQDNLKQMQNIKQQCLKLENENNKLSTLLKLERENVRRAQQFFN